MADPLASFASVSAGLSAADVRTRIAILDQMTAPGPMRLPVRTRAWSEGKSQAARGDAIVAWLQVHGYADTDAGATTVATELVRAQALVPLQRVDSAANAFVALPDKYYAHYALSVGASRGLNVFAPALLARAPRPVFAVLTELSGAFSRLVDGAVARMGHEVLYERVRRDGAWADILVLLAELAHSSLVGEVDEDVKKACLFNLYNVLIIHGKLVLGHPRDITARGKFFNTIGYEIAGHRINSTELEHGVLRLKMEDNHPLAALRVAKKDPRMHFILNCGAQSCPPLVAMSPKLTEEMLATATRRFIRANVTIDTSQRRIELSRLWKWFRVDFTPEAPDSDLGLMVWIAKNGPQDVADQIDLIMDYIRKGQVKITFAKYNWGDNGDWSTSDTAFMALYDYSFKKNA